MVGTRLTTFRKAKSTASFFVFRPFCFITVSTSSSSISMLVRVMHQAYTSGQQAQGRSHRDGHQEYHQQAPTEQQGDHTSCHPGQRPPVCRVGSAAVEQ